MIVARDFWGNCPSCTECDPPARIAVITVQLGDHMTLLCRDCAQDLHEAIGAALTSPAS